MTSSNLTDRVTFGIYVTASQGCEHAQPILQQALNFKSSEDSLIVLDISDGDCLAGNGSHIGGLPHLIFDSADEFKMRMEAVNSRKGTHTLVIEDHMTINEEFLPALREFLMKYQEIPALGFYATNGTPENFGSRILFRWIFGLASLELWPRSPEPVCSAFLLNNNFFTAYESGLGRKVKTGEIESHLLPYIAPRVNGLMPKALHVEHSQRVSIFQAAQGVFENTRISAHLERDTAILVWLLILFQRHYFRFLKIVKVSRPSVAESLGVFFLASVGFIGGIVGRFGSVRNAYGRLARTHTQSQK